MSGGGRRHNGPHNGHYNMAAMTIEYNGHHPPREPRKEENTLVRRSFRRSGDEWRADSRRCVWKKLAIRAFVSPITTTNFLSKSNILSFFYFFFFYFFSLSIFRSFIAHLSRPFVRVGRPGIALILAIPGRKISKNSRIFQFPRFFPHVIVIYFSFFFFILQLTIDNIIVLLCQRTSLSINSGSKIVT